MFGPPNALPIQIDADQPLCLQTGQVMPHRDRGDTEGISEGLHRALPVRPYMIHHSMTRIYHTIVTTTPMIDLDEDRSKR